MLMQTPQPLEEQPDPDLETARKIIETALGENRTVLTPSESKRLLTCFQIPVAQPLQAKTEEEAVRRALALGFPVAVKIDSPDITHKTDVGGVQLNITDEQGVIAAYRTIMASVQRAQPSAVITGVTVEPMLMHKNARELFIGILHDPVFGPAMTFGSGGIEIEVYADRAVGLPPLNSFLVREMIRSTRASKLLGEFRGMPPVDMKALETRCCVSRPWCASCHGYASSTRIPYSWITPAPWRPMRGLSSRPTPQKRSRTSTWRYIRIRTGWSRNGRPSAGRRSRSGQSVPKTLKSSRRSSARFRPKPSTCAS